MPPITTAHAPRYRFFPPRPFRVTSTPAPICTVLADLPSNPDPDQDTDLFLFISDDGFDDCAFPSEYDDTLEQYLRHGKPFTIQRIPAYSPDHELPQPSGLSALTPSERNPSLASLS